MPDDIRKLLENSGVSEPVAEVFARHLHRTSDNERVEFEALVFTGGGARVKSLKFRHWIINWREIVLEAIPALAQAGMHALKGDDQLATWLHLLQGFKALLDAATVDLANDHATLAKLLWLDHRAEPRVSHETARRESGLGDTQFERVLDGLLALGIIEMDAGEWIVKRDRILFVA